MILVNSELVTKKENIQVIEENGVLLDIETVKKAKTTSGEMIELYPEECFFKLEGYEDYYVSSYAKAISLKQNRVHLLKAISEKNDYQKFNLSKGRKSAPIKVHRAVAQIYCYNPYSSSDVIQINGKSERIEVHHIDKNPMNNHACNLMYVRQGLHPIADMIKEYYYYKDGNYVRINNVGNISNIIGEDISSEDVLLAIKDNKLEFVDKDLFVYQVKQYKIAIRKFNEAA